MKLENIAVILIIALIAGAFLGWAVAAWLLGEGNAGQSTGTGIGCAAGLLVGGLVLLFTRKSPNA
jgi:hypothetical protein